MSQNQVATLSTQSSESAALPASIAEQPPGSAQWSQLAVCNISNGEIKLTDVGAVEVFSRFALASGYFKEGDAKEPAQAAMKILFGQKMGLDPLESITEMFFNKGKPEVFAKLIARKIKESNGRVDYQIDEWNDDLCRISFFENGKLCGPPIEFTYEQARALKVTSNIPWLVDRRMMLFYKAIARGYKAYLLHLFKIAVQVKEEMEDAQYIENLQEKAPETAKELAKQLAQEKKQEAAKKVAAKAAAPPTPPPAQEEVTDVEVLPSDKQGNGDAQPVGRQQPAAPPPAPITPEPTTADKLEAKAAVAKDPELATMMESSAAAVEKIGQKDGVKILGATKAAGWTNKELIAFIVEKFGLGEKTWSREMTTHQRDALLQHLEQNKK